MNKKYKFLSIFLIAALFLAACGNSNSNDNDKKNADKDKDKDTGFKVGMVTDVGGIDDRSFNQSAWEGLQRFGEENDLTEKTNFNYLQSYSESDYQKNLNTFVKEKFNIVYGVGYQLEKAITQVANENPDTQFAIIDTLVEGVPNLVSLNFAEHEGSFLVGAVAAMTTKTKKVGFLGGTESSLIEKFESGFIAGVHAIDPSIEVEVKYAGAFDKADLGKVAASGMYNAGVDIIYHAAGATGKGVFSEAKAIKEADPSREVWVIGVDRDQADEGLLSDKKTNVTLTSMVKRVDIAVFDTTTKSKNGELQPGENLQFGIADDAVGIAETQDNLTPEILAKVDELKAQILSGEIIVPSTRSE